MALTIVSFPPIVNFMENPILVSAASDLTKQFLKVGIACDTVITDTAQSISWARTFKFSIPVDVAGNPVKFDIASCAQTAMNVYKHEVITAAGNYSCPVISIKFYLYEEYLESGVSYPVDAPTFANTASANKQEIYVLPGGLSDFERYRLSASDTVSQFVEPMKFLTRKPDGEIVHPDEIHLVPFVLGTTASFDMKLYNKGVSAAISSNSYTLNSYRSYTSALSMNGKSGKTLFCQMEVGGVAKSKSPEFYVGERESERFHFQFINGFGLRESISCYSRSSLQYAITTTQNTRVVERTFKSINNQFTTKTKPQATYGMSSGYVNEEWADWFLNEFLTTESAFMKINGIFVPVTIVPDSKVTVYDHSKNQLCHVDFDVKLAFSGSVNNRVR